MATQQASTFLQPKLQQAAAAGQLGSLLKSYNASVIEVSKGLGLSIIPLIFGLVFAAGVVIAINTSTDIGVLLISSVIAFFLLAGGSYVAYGALRDAGQKIYLFQHGFIVIRWGRVSVYPWAQIQAIRQHITRHYKKTAFGEKYTGTTYEYTVQRAEGKTLELNNYVRNIEELGEAITLRLSEFLFPTAMASLKAGATLTFGPWSINSQGISNKKGMLPWQEVHNYQIVGGRIHILRKKGGYWDSNAVRSLPNVFVFTALVDYLLKAQGKA